MTCPGLDPAGSAVIAGALRAFDCMAADATATAFDRLFGGHGALTAALTIVLTLYVGWFAVGLLTGRASLGLGALTPRMLGLGAALTLATSWAAYSEVVWTLLTAGPDWVAGQLLGIKGSASDAFAMRLDTIFAAILDAAAQAQQAAKDAKGMTPSDLLSWAALLLLLGTVGVLITSRIALAALLAVGPVFVILALFSGTRGLFEGWLRMAVLFALVPLFAVLIGVGSVAMLGTVVDGLAGGAIDMRQAAVVFTVAAIHCALMATALKLVSGLTAEWRVPFGEVSADARAAPRAAPVSIHQPAAPTQVGNAPMAAPVVDDRIRAIVSASRHDGAASSTPSASIIRFPGSPTSPPRAGGAPSHPGGGRVQDIRRQFSRSPKETLP